MVGNATAITSLRQLLVQGLITILPADFSVVTGGFQVVKTVDITGLVTTGGKGYDVYNPTFPEVEAKHFSPYSPVGGTFNSYYNQLPFVGFTGYTTGAVNQSASFSISTSYVPATPSFAVTLNFLYFTAASTGPGSSALTQYIAYKIYSPDNLT